MIFSANQRHELRTGTRYARVSELVRQIGRVAVLGGSLGLAACTSSTSSLNVSDAPISNATDEAAFSPSDAPYSDLQLVSSLPPPTDTNQGTDVPVAENDLLKVDVFQVDDLDTTVRVDARGRISLPLIGVVEAGGKSITELEAEIEALYGARYLQNPDVSIFVEESAGQQVAVDGAVAKPGIYAITSNSTLLQVVAQAGGFADMADETKLYVFRQVGDKKLVANYSVSKIREGKQPDPRIYGGDLLVSFSSGTKIAMKNLREALGIAANAGRVVAPF